MGNWPEPGYVLASFQLGQRVYANTSHLSQGFLGQPQTYTKVINLGTGLSPFSLMLLAKRFKLGRCAAHVKLTHDFLIPCLLLISALPGRGMPPQNC